MRRDEAEEDAFVVEVQVRQVIREVGEVVADAGFHVRADVTINRGQCATAALICIGEAEGSHFDQTFPALRETPVCAYRAALRCRLFRRFGDAPECGDDYFNLLKSSK
jgi:hypothetical protein